MVRIKKGSGACAKLTSVLLAALFIIPLGTVGASDRSYEDVPASDIGPIGMASRAGSNVTINGSVKDAGGLPPAQAIVLAVNSTNMGLVNFSITNDGNYSFTVPSNDRYFLYMAPFSGQSVQGYAIHGFFPIARYVNVASVNISSDFVITPAYELILKGTDANNKIVDADNFTNVRWSTEMDDRNAFSVWADVDNGMGQKLPSVLIPIGETRDLYFQWVVPGYGNVVVRLTNNLTGYRGTAQGGQIIDVNGDLAFSEEYRMLGRYSEYYKAGYEPGSDAMGHSGNATTACENSLILSGTSRLAQLNRCASEAILGIEAIELDKADSDIRKYRMGDVHVTVKDLNGMPIDGANVTYNQSSHDFLFGVFDNLKEAGLEGFQKCRDIGVNYATAGFYWSISEPTEGKIEYQLLNDTWGIKELTDMGYTVHVHALIYLNDLVTPAYLKTKDFASFNKSVYSHVYNLVNVYKDRVHIWNVVNEANSLWASAGFTRPQLTELIRTGVKAIKDADPDGRILVNNPNDWFGQSSTLGYLIEDYDNYTLSISDYLDLLELDGVDFDIIGQQMYNGGYSSFFEKAGIGPGMPVATFDLGYESEVFDKLSVYNKNIAMSELSVSSYWNDSWKDAGYWHGKWNQSLQAQFLTQFYTVAFSKEKMESLTWWDLDDNTSFLDGGALFDKDMKPKEAFYALRDLIAGWTTNGNGTTNRTGELDFKGYAGDYNITVNWKNKTMTVPVHIDEMGSKNVSFIIDEQLKPDLVLNPWELMLRTDDFQKNGKVYIGSVLWNEGERQATNITVRLLKDDPVTGAVIFEKTVPILDMGNYEQIDVAWNATGMYGTQTLYLVVDPLNNITELNESNNQLTIIIPLPLPNWGHLKASVVDHITGEPLEAALVKMLYLNGSEYRKGVTGNDGNFTFQKAPSDCYLIEAELTGYSSANGTGCVSSLNTTTVKVRMRPITTGSITGTVFDNKTMNPIPGAVVKLEELNLTTSTNLGGGYGFFNIERGTYNITVTAPVYIGQTKRITIVSNSTTTENFYIKKDVGILQGYITDSKTGDAIANATIMLSDKMGQISDTEGLFIFIDVPAGTYSLYVSSEGYNSRSVSAFINPQRTTWVNVTLDPVYVPPDLNGTISGIVKDAKNGSAIGRARVSIDELGRSIITDSDGKYKFEKVPPGNYTINVTAVKYKGMAKKVSLGAKGSVAADFELKRTTVKTDDSGRLVALALVIVAAVVVAAIVIVVLWKRSTPAKKGRTAVSRDKDGDDDLDEEE